MVSVVIPTKNSAKHIGACIRSIRCGSYRDTEIIVVDNDSTDKTRKIAQHYNCRVYRQGDERSAQRNYGAKKAIGEYLLFLDSDMAVSTHVIRECVSLCTSITDNVNGLFTVPSDGLYIRERILSGGMWGRARDFERSFYEGTNVDAIRFMKKELFTGFNEYMTGVEDWDFDRRFVGKKGVCHQEIYHDEEAMTLKDYYRKKQYYCGWMKKYNKVHNNPKETNAIYRFIGVFVEGGKWKKITKHPVLFAKVLILKFVTAIAYLTAKEC